MANYTTEQLRNIVLIGHSSSGKTTLAEAMLFNTGGSAGAAVSKMARP